MTKKTALETDIEWIKNKLNEISKCIEDVPSIRAQTKFQWWLIGGIGVVMMGSLVAPLVDRVLKAIK